MPNSQSETASTELPLITSETDRLLRGSLEEGWALCLSGGGYRAMLFHTGALWRINELGFLPKLDRISSVSGGSITAAVLGVNWSDLGLDSETGVAGGFESAVVKPIRKLAGKTVDRKAIFTGLFGRGSIGAKVANAYRSTLFGTKTLQDLPDHPRFVINATNVQTGALWRFSKPYMGDYRVGRVFEPTVELALAVAASSAFPPVLSPLVLELDPTKFDPDPDAELQRPPYTSSAVLSDGGVYDNIGIETAWKRYTSVLVSDAGGKMQPEPNPDSNWAQHSLRVLNVIDNQVRSLRKRQVISSYKAGERGGAYWGIRTDIAAYKLQTALDCPVEKTTKLADTPTRLKATPEKLQMKLINWGYAVCDAALRRHVDATLPAPGGFPYPRVGVR